MKQPMISLCMIVKNEQEHLPRCLESVRGVVDEMIVVDTGSEDSTIQIAKQYGANVIHQAWQGDFSAARNRGLQQARGQWILFLDADEELADDTKGLLRLYATQEGCEAFFLQIHNLLGNGQQGATINPILRMFRNRPEYRFAGRIHEQIASSILEHRPACEFRLTEVVIRHYGYTQAAVKKKNKTHRNIELLLQALAEEENQPFHLYNLGVEWLRTGQLQRALECFQKARSLVSPEISYAHLLYKYEVRCLMALGHLEEASRLALEGAALYEDYPDLNHLAGDVHAALGQTSQAIQHYKRALKTGGAAGIYHTEEGMGSFQTWYRLGVLYEEHLRGGAAVACYKEALRGQPSLLPPLMRLCRLLSCTHGTEEVIHLLAEHLSCSTEESVLKVARVLEATGNPEAALGWLEQMSPGSRQDAVALEKKRLLLFTGRREATTRFLHTGRNHPDAMLYEACDDLLSGRKPNLKRLAKSQAYPVRCVLAEPPAQLPSDLRQTDRNFALLVDTLHAHRRIRDVFPLLSAWQVLQKGMPPGESQALSTHHLSMSLVKAADRHLCALSELPEETLCYQRARWNLPLHEPTL